MSAREKAGQTVVRRFKNRFAVAWSARAIANADPFDTPKHAVIRELIYRVGRIAPPVQQPAANEGQPPVPKNPAPASKLPPTTAAQPVLVSQTYRLPTDLVKELTRVAVSRKLDRTAPWSQQDIVAQAIRDWLAKQASMEAFTLA